MDKESIYFENEDGEEETIERASIMEEDDIEYLKGLYLELDEAAELMASVARGWAECGSAHEALSHKVGAHRLGQKWIKMRLRELGEVPPGDTPTEDKLRAEVKRLNAKVKEQAAIITALLEKQPA